MGGPLLRRADRNRGKGRADAGPFSHFPSGHVDGLATPQQQKPEEAPLLSDAWSHCVAPTSRICEGSHAAPDSAKIAPSLLDVLARAGSWKGLRWKILQTPPPLKWKNRKSPPEGTFPVSFRLVIRTPLIEDFLDLALYRLPSFPSGQAGHQQLVIPGIRVTNGGDHG